MKSLSSAFLALVAALTLAFAPAEAIAKSKDKKKDPDSIGDRDVSKGINFYSLEKEIALGKQVAQEVERQARVVDDPVIAEYNLCLSLSNHGEENAFLFREAIDVWRR